MEPSYQGKNLTVGTQKYIYWTPPTDHRNKNNVFGDQNYPLDIVGSSGSGYCCATCAGRADSKVAPFMDTTDNAVAAKAMANAIIAKMDKAGMGGLGIGGYTPTGCALSFNGGAEATDYNNALSYMQKVKSTDPLQSCRNNYVVLITDGAPNRAYDAACDSAACSASPPTAACTCRAVLAANELQNAGVSTVVVGFSSSTASQYPRDTLNNIAKAGGTGSAYFAVREADLESAIVNAIYSAAQGSYSTSPASASSGSQTTAGITLGTMILDTRVDFPGWKGQLIAYETSSGTPTLAWSAQTVSFNAATDPNFWKKRNVWTSNGTTMVKFDVDQSTGAVNNKTTLKTLGLGATDTEAERVARWLLGDPAMGNPAVLGAIINSTPIDVGSPGISPLPGGQAFYDAHVGRANLTYVGSSDGMLHAFFTKPVTVGSKSYLGGQEAFAYIPQTMLAVANKLFAQGGQLPDPRDHIYGLANSPKAKSLCTAYCDGVGTPQWKTVLAMAYGFGGTESFVLDITDPFDGGGVKTTAAPAPLLWSTQYGTPSSNSAYDNDLGLTTSVPAFYYAKGATKDDFRLIFGSYYIDGSGATGKVLVNTSAKTGAMVQESNVTPPNSCSVAYGLMSDVATARNFATGEENQILAAYVGDTWGNLYRYVPAVTGVNHFTSTTGTVSLVDSYTCNQPIHYAPAIVQLDRDNSANRTGEIYIVQVTNSALDDETKAYPASKMIIRRDVATAPGNVADDPNFSKITLTAGVASQLCGLTNAAGTCLEALPATARPNATPMAVLKRDGSGFQIISTWYQPAADACSNGITYLTIHEIAINGSIGQKFATKLASEPVTSAVFAGAKLMFVSQGGVTDLTGMLPPGLSWAGGGSAGPPGAAERVRRLGWVEIP
ncbi:MAG TPA: PilC/PilY family type IV pilus protein [Polyangia bacterium]|nr:PilC/PilY family type IV pilus protein [Polyangia bacterium]